VYRADVDAAGVSADLARKNGALPGEAVTTSHSTPMHFGNMMVCVGLSE
jgi:hypothetical protein